MYVTATSLQTSEAVDPRPGDVGEGEANGHLHFFSESSITKREAATRPCKPHALSISVKNKDA